MLVAITDWFEEFRFTTSWWQGVQGTRRPHVRHSLRLLRYAGSYGAMLATISTFMSMPVAFAIRRSATEWPFDVSPPDRLVVIARSTWSRDATGGCRGAVQGYRGGDNSGSIRGQPSRSKLI